MPDEPQDLPLLQELFWVAPCRFSRAFKGAQPVQVCVPGPMIVDWLAATSDASPPEQAFTPLARVRELCVISDVDSMWIVRVLRAVTQLRTLSVRADPNGFSWCGHAAFSGLTHNHLRTIHLTSSSSDEAVFRAVRPDGDCAMQLRQAYFPRLQLLTFRDRWYFATPMPDREEEKKSTHRRDGP
jgi:hypothetical protein